MDIQVGDRVTYRYLNTLDKKKITRIIINENEIKDYINIFNDVNKEFAIEILKIERPKYEGIEEKEELLTEEEKEFLKQYIKILNIEDNIKFIEKFMNELYVHTDDTFYKLEINIGFNKLQKEKSYTLKELGIESMEE